MGDYLTQTITDKQVLKLGTAGNWRSIRRDELAKINDMGGYTYEGTPLYKVLDNPHITWRFPYPDEDEDINKPNLIQNIESDRRMIREESFLADPSWMKDWEGHKNITINISPLTNGYYQSSLHNPKLPQGPNFFIPCPLSKGFNISNTETNNGKEMPSYIIISGEYYVHGDPVTIFKCGWCGQGFTQSGKEISDMKDYLVDYARRSKNNHWIEVAHRIYSHIPREDGA